MSSTTGAASQLALLGGTPLRHAEPRQYPVWSKEARERVDRLLEKGVAVGLSRHQPEIAEIEDALAAFHEVPRALGTSTGHGGLHAALIGLELTAGDEVMTSPYTYGVSVSCILHNNCVPTFSDVLEGTGLMDPASVRERLTDRTRALLVPHIFGNPADMTELGKIVEEHDLKIIEDGSQAHGARHRGRMVGSFGDASGFSSNGAKPIAATEAGYMVTKHENVYWNAVVSTQHAAGMGEIPGRGAEPDFPEELRPATDAMIYTYRLTPVNAALMLDRIEHVEQGNEVKRRHLEILRDGLADLKAVSVPPPLFEEDDSAVHKVIVRFHEDVVGIEKSTYLKALNAEGLYAEEYLRKPVNLSPRLSPNWTGPRVMWTENLKRANYDATKLDLPGVDKQIKNHFHLPWDYTEFDADFIKQMVNVFVKVDEDLDALRAYERGGNN